MPQLASWDPLAEYVPYELFVVISYIVIFIGLPLGFLCFIILRDNTPRLNNRIRNRIRRLRR